MTYERHSRALAAMAALALIAAFALPCEAEAQTRTIKVLVPFAVDSGTDVLARTVSEQVGRDHGVKMEFQDTLGSNGAIGTNAMAHAAADGNNLLISNTTFVVNPHLRKVEYDAVTSFEPVCELASTPGVIAVAADSPYRTFADMIKAARAKPGAVSFQVVKGTPFHIGLEMLNRAAKVSITAVPFHDNAAAIKAVLDGQSTAVFAGYPTVTEALKAGKMRALATDGLERAALLPDVPTIAESGYKGFEVDSWFGVFAPAKTPKVKISELATWYEAALKAPEVKAKLATLGVSPVGKCGAGFVAAVREQYDEFGRIIREAKITAD